MEAMQAIEWLDPLVERERNPELERYVKARVGIVPPMVGFFGACPWILRAFFGLGVTARVHLSHDLIDLVALVVSRDNSCRNCYAASRMLMRLTGMREGRIRELEQNLETAQLQASTRVALEFVRRISRSNPPPGAADKKALLDVGYSEAAIKELAFVAAENVFYNRLMTLPALPPRLNERLARSPFLRLLRPLFARSLSRLRKTGQPEVLADELKTGPYTYLVLALDGLPVAGSLRRALDEAWASPHLSARAKALVFAVIARGLGSAHAEQEAFQLLASEGLQADTLLDILAHLAAPALDPTEALILPYARDTIWYEPASVQRKGRALRQQLSAAQFLELVGVAGLANLVSRLDLLLDAH